MCPSSFPLARLQHDSKCLSSQLDQEAESHELDDGAAKQKITFSHLEPP